jgi:hypothetical protein
MVKLTLLIKLIEKELILVYCIIKNWYDELGTVIIIKKTR